MVVVSEHAWRSAFTSTVCDPLDTFTGSTCRKVVVFGMLVFLWLTLLLIDTCCWSCLWRSVWCFSTQLFALHIILHMYSLVVWSFEKQFLHNFYFVANLSSTDLSGDVFICITISSFFLSFPFVFHFDLSFRPIYFFYLEDLYVSWIYLVYMKSWLTDF